MVLGTYANLYAFEEAGHTPVVENVDPKLIMVVPMQVIEPNVNILDNPLGGKKIL